MVYFQSEKRNGKVNSKCLIYIGIRLYRMKYQLIQIQRKKFIIVNLLERFSGKKYHKILNFTFLNFRNYEEYFERQITLDTEVWSCSISGKSNLTFDEAVESEESAREILKSVDKTLIRVILYLFSKATGRISVRTLVTEIHDAIKDSYFVDEVILCQKKKFRIKSIKPKNKNQKDSDEENQSPG